MDGRSKDANQSLRLALQYLVCVVYWATGEGVEETKVLKSLLDLIDTLLILTDGNGESGGERANWMHGELGSAVFKGADPNMDGGGMANNGSCGNAISGSWWFLHCDAACWR